MGEIKLDELQRILAIGKEVDLHRKLRHAKELRNSMHADYLAAKNADADPELIDAINLALCETVDYVAELADQYEYQLNENKRKGWS